MDTTIKSLTGLGLTETEAMIYLAGLGAASSAATELAHRSHVKRPTVYHALETLMEKGLAAKKHVGGRVVFTMSPPESLGRMLDRHAEEIVRRKDALKSVVSQLRGRSSPAPDETDVVHYSGLEGVKQAVEEALYCRSGRWDILAPRKNFFSETDKAYADYFMESRRRRRIDARTLWEKLFQPKRKLSAEDLRTRQPRYLPDGMTGKFSSTLILFDDRVLLLSSAKNPSAVLIRSKEMHDTVEAMFGGLWASAEPYPLHRA